MPDSHRLPLMGQLTHRPSRGLVDEPYVHTRPAERKGILATALDSLACLAYVRGVFGCHEASTGKPVQGRRGPRHCKQRAHQHKPLAICAGKGWWAPSEIDSASQETYPRASLLSLRGNGEPGRKRSGSVCVAPRKSHASFVSPQCQAARTSRLDLDNRFDAIRTRDRAGGSSARKRSEPRAPHPLARCSRGCRPHRGAERL